uniref:Uncharacterized protein n=1 Tax=Meloidogyne enterolobii TaxID=390850 RepID=A0A6V7W802_MELEN|nr:unnamed protein product [Meloidogyne enterolobii]
MFNNNNKSTPLKRKKLTLKPNELKDEEFLSPVKRRAKMSTNTCEEFFRQSGPTTTSFSTNKFLFQRPPIDESFISPLKQQWKGFLSSSSNSSTDVNKNWLKTPSPARRLKQSVICKNIGNLLLMTPEKEYDEEEEEFDEDNENEEVDDDEEGEEKLKEENSTLKTTSNSIKKYPTKKRTTTKKQNGGNFVKLNMRHRRFAPSSKFGIKKKWRKKFKN